MGMSFELEKVLDLEKWERVQDSIAKTTKVAIILVDYRGRPVSKHSEIQPFCQLARSNPELSKYCETCDARAGLEAVRTEKPYIYHCHFDIVDMAIPILINDRYVGAIMAGEILLDDENQKLEKILHVPDQTILDDFKTKNQELFNQYPKLSLTELLQVADMLARLSEYIVSEAIKKEYLIKMYQQTIHLTPKEHDSLVPPTTENLEVMQKDLNSTLLNQRLEDFSQGYQTKNQQLQPALDYLYANKTQLVTLKDLAKVTNLSQSHLSRLLKEELGESFKTMYIKMKMTWAKELLATTDLTITEISEQLGYLESSYFVRLFKRTQGITPLNYRKVSRKH